MKLNGRGASIVVDARRLVGYLQSMPRIATAPDLTCPAFRARVMNSHSASFEGPNALDIARSLGIWDVDIYWEIVMSRETGDY